MCCHIQYISSQCHHIVARLAHKLTSAGNQTLDSTMQLFSFSATSCKIRFWKSFKIIFLPQLGSWQVSLNPQAWRWKPKQLDIFSSYCWTSGCAAVMSLHPVFLCLQTHVSATIIGSLPSKSQQLSVICENAFWLQSAFNSFQPHHIPLEFLIFCLLFWSNSSVRAIAAKRQLAITWNPWKCQIDGWDSGWWTSELPMHTNATKFCGKNTNTVEVQKKYSREEYLGWVKLMGAKVQKLMAAPIPRYCCNCSLDSRICTDTIVQNNLIYKCTHASYAVKCTHVH